LASPVSPFDGIDQGLEGKILQFFRNAVVILPAFSFVRRKDGLKNIPIKNNKSIFLVFDWWRSMGKEVRIW
jgi:hypothetical protein